MHRRSYFIWSVCCLSLLSPLRAYALDVHPGFNPGLLIADSAFTDTRAFGGAEGIQRFLISKGSVLANTSLDFLAKLREPDNVALKLALDDPEPNMGRLRTAAELIWDASRASGLNPQVILVTLQKEQSLIQGVINQDRLQRALNYAMGFDCPDTSGCGNLFPGFYYQLFGNVDAEGNRYLGATKSLMRSFSAPAGRGPSIGGVASKVGDTITLQNTLGDYVGILKQQPIRIENRATASLYRYTPHVFNGNYNFWKFFTSWFKYSNGTLLTSSQDGTLFIIQNGTRQKVLPFVVKARGLRVDTAITASPLELQDYPLGPTYGPADNTVAIINSSFFVFSKGLLHPVSPFVLVQRKLDPTRSIPLSSDEQLLFPQGPQLTPSNGTILRGQGSGDTYLVDGNVLKLFSSYTLQQYGAAKSVQIIPNSEIAIYPKQGYVIPREGSLIRASSSDDVYLIHEARRLPLTPALFKNLGYSLKNVVRLHTDAEIASIPIGPPAAPREGTYFSITGSPEMYLFKGGTKHLISAFVAKQRGISPDYSFDASIVSNWPDGIAMTPRDGTLVKGESLSTVYLVMKGQLRPLNTELFTFYGFKQKNVIRLSDEEVNISPKGSFATPPENTFFTIRGTKELYVFRNGTKQRIYPFVASQRHMTSDVTFSADIVDSWPSGNPLPPRDGTLVQGQGGSTVYLVTQGVLRSVSKTVFKRRGYSLKQIKILPKLEIDQLLKGSPILK